MLLHYLKLAIRNLRELRSYTFVNIVGLSVGLACCILILQYLRTEFGYDRHHEGDIYRIATEFTFSDRQDRAATSPPALAAGIKRDFLEVSESARVFNAPGVDKFLVSVADRFFLEEKVRFADPAFFDLMTYDFVAGDAGTALDEPFSVVVSSEIAQKLFPGQNPIGEIVEIESTTWGTDLYAITGVFDKAAYKTQIDGDYYISAMSGALGDRFYELQEWGGNNFFYTFVRLQQGVDPVLLESQLPAWLEVYAAERLAQLGFSKRHFLEPVEDIYLHSGLPTTIGPTGSSTYFYTLGVIALFILVIACINFTNLATAKALLRAKEVGVRKVVGASSSVLVRQFMLEAFIYTILAVALAYMLADTVAPTLSSVVGKSLSTDLLSTGYDSGILAAFIVVTTLMVGAYPALYLASFKPIDVLRGYLGGSSSNQGLRKGLVVLQFIVSIALIQGILIITQQMNYIDTRDLGFDKTSKLVIPNNSLAAQQNFFELKNLLLQNSAIVAVGGSSTYPSAVNLENGLINSPGRPPEEAVVGYTSFVDTDYMELMAFNFVAGRNFDLNRPSDAGGKTVINETLARGVGYDPIEAVGKTILYNIPNGRSEFEIIGVVQDFHAFALHEEILGQAFFWDNGMGASTSYVVADVTTANSATLISDIEAAWEAVNPGEPLEYFFMEDAIESDYLPEQRMGDLIFSAAVVAILISCFGLLGLTAFAAERRSKEIAVRKTLGASISNVTFVLCRDFMGLVIMAFALATPIAWYGMNQWLNSFYYRTEVEWSVFAIGGMAGVTVALVTMSWQAIRAAVSNPVDGLRLSE